MVWNDETGVLSILAKSMAKSKAILPLYKAMNNHNVTLLDNTYENRQP